jgi:putative aldouronate transport system substrate-binding protein
MTTYSRRKFLKYASFTAAAALAACQPAATPTEQKPAEPPAEPTKVEAQVETKPTEKPTEPPAPTAAPVKAEPVKVVFIESWFGVPQYAEVIAPVTEALSKKAQAEGVNIAFESLVLDDHANKYAVMYASGADFTMAFDAPWYKMNTLRDQKALVALDTLIDPMGPKLKEEITEKIYNFNFENGPDGKRHLYGIPTAFYYGGTTGVTIREDLRKKYNLPAPDPAIGWTSFEPYMQGIAENEKGMTPFANTAKYAPVGIAHMSQGFWSYGPISEAALTCVVKTFDKGEYKLVEVEDVPGFADRVKMLRSWWEKGWINKADLPLSAGTETVEKDFLIPGKAAACMQNDAEVKAFQEFNPAMKAANPDADLKGYDMTGLASGKFQGMGALKQWNFVVFNASAPQAQQEAGVQWFNWLASSPENIDMWLMGIEGTNWKSEPNNRYSEIAGVDAATNYRRQWYVSGISGRFQRLDVNIIPEAEAIIKANATESNWVFNPYEGFSVDRKPLEESLTKMAAIADEAGHAMNTGQAPAEEAIAKYKKMMDEAGRTQVKEALQKQLDEYITNFTA